MVKRIQLPILLMVGALVIGTVTGAMVDLNEEFLIVPDQKTVIITESASLSESQKQAIQLALNKLFIEQVASTSVYNEIVGALAAAINSPEVTESSKRFVAGLKDLIKVFFKNVKLSDEQAAKVRDVLETLKALALLQKGNFDSQTIDDAMRKQIITLQQRLSAHIMPLSVGMQELLSQDAVNEHQKYIVELIVDLIKEALAILPAGSNAAGAANPPALAEPLMPERIIMEDEQEFA